MKVRTLVNPFSCIQRFEKQDWNTVFHNFNGNLDVEVGCGSGSFLNHHALKNLDRSVVGFETRKRMAEQIEQKRALARIENARIFCGNAQFGIDDMFDDNTIDRIFIFHPDPWPKKTHHKRRLINTLFLDIIYKKLKSGGLVYISTDVAELWEFMNTTMLESGQFVAINDEEFWTTHYQTRWNDISKEQKRTITYGTFKVIK